MHTYILELISFLSIRNFYFVLTMYFEFKSINIINEIT